MPLPILPMYQKPHRQEDYYKNQLSNNDYLTRLRGELEGYESGLPNFIELGQIWGVVPPQAGNLIIDPSFELNRGSWLLPQGCRIAELTVALHGFVPRQGKYALLVSKDEGYDITRDNAGIIYANAGMLTPILDNQLVVHAAYVRGIVGATATAFCGFAWYDANKAFSSFTAGAGVVVNTAAWQLITHKSFPPAAAEYFTPAYQFTGLTTATHSAAIDTVLCFPAHQQTETISSAGTVTQADVNEHVLLTVTMAPLLQTAGVISILTPVIITGECTYSVRAVFGTDATFRIRRGTTIAGAQLWIHPNLQTPIAGGNSVMHITARDTAPTATGESWVLTVQMATADGGATANHSLHAHQEYI